jgi:CRISPR/Cas system-associated exonuclease Cas4 (RecB family)
VLILNRIKKKIFLETKTCPRRGWLLRNQTSPAALSLGEQFRIDQGIEIGEKAREAFPGGVLVEEQSTELAAKKTEKLLADPSVKIIFEATFLFGDYAAKSDILIRNGNSWDLIEVKSSTSKKIESKKDLSEFLDDMAYTAMIIGKNGLSLSTIRLMLLSEKFRLGMSIDALFESFDYTNDVKNRVTAFEKLLDSCATITSQPEEPAFRLISNCKNCDFFEHCIPKSPEYTIFDIPRLSEKQLLDLHSKGIFLIRNIPESFRLTDTQKLPVECMRSGKQLVDPRLQKELEKITWPVHYLDFETTQTAFPLYSDVAPYESIPTQYSIHSCTSCGSVTLHKEYFADPSRDCRHELAKSMIRDLDGTGSVLMYSTYEKTIIKGLIQTCPDLAGPLTTILNRLVDLIECTKCVGHPEFQGRNSIKYVLPALVPDLSYKGMTIANGDDALVTFAYMARGKFTPEECAIKREEMLRYCKLDTLAMVKIHEVFTRLAR